MIINQNNSSGPNFDDDDDDDDGSGGAQGGPQNGSQKPKTAQQRSGTALVKYIVDKVDGECYSFR